jgi:DNA-binding transcriptional LysR family regulator
MIDDLRALAVFARTAELGSFRAAASALNLSPSVVSHHVARLEERLGAPLLYRTTRRLSLTPEGEALFDAARQMLEAAEAGLDAVAGGDGGPTGELRLTVPGFLEGTSFFEDLATFLVERPRVRLTVVSSDERRDLVAGAFDLALRVGQLADSDLRVRRVATLRRVLVAAPSYLASRSAPSVPAELGALDCLQLGSRAPEVTLFPAGGGAPERARFRPRATVSSGLSIHRLVRAGAGVAALPEVIVRDDVASGALVRVLPGWSLDELGVYLAWPDGAVRRHLTARLVAFLAPRLERLFGGA